MLVTKDNFERTMIGAFNAYKVSNYNEYMAISSNDVIFHRKCEENCINIINKIEEAGYNPYDLLNNILKELSINNLKNGFSDSLKSKIDDDFEIETDEYYVNWGLKFIKREIV